MNTSYYAVIMAGGIGSRFWPMSRSSYPKQFHDVMGTGRTLIQASFDRLQGLIPTENILVITSAEYTPQVKEQLPELSNENILAEPIGRNTAPCLAYSSFRILKEQPNAQVLISPADHLIRDEEKFRNDLELALKTSASKDYIMTLGIVPTRPDTGYGYIQYHSDEAENGYYKVKTFTEKPNLEMAKTFVRSGDFLWNSGIFVSSAATFVAAFKRFLPEMHDQFEGIQAELCTAAETGAIAEVYGAVKPISIDYGIMEKAENVYVIKSNFDWSDLGTWNSLYEQQEKDEAGNAVQGKALLLDSARNMVYNSGSKQLVLKDIEDFIVVNTADVLLILPRENEQAVKEVVAAIRSNKLDKLL